MPVSKLLCEGGAKGTDAVVLSALLTARGVSSRVEPWGDKQRLAASVGALLEVDVHARCICDRDFDQEPIAGGPFPLLRDRKTVGYRWARHEIESYLVEPAMAKAALARAGWATAYEAILERAARSLTAYAAARWTVRCVARQFPHLRYEPDGSGEWHLVDAADCQGWLESHLEGHRGAFPAAEDYRAHFEELRGRLDRMELGDLLLWISGKNILAALSGEAAKAGLVPMTAGELRVELREWVRANPDAALAFVPEWARFVDLLAAEL